jgi:hypothetical protein
MKDLIEDTARGNWTLRGYGRMDDSEELFNALAQEGLFKGHTESVVRILESHDKGKGIVIEQGFRDGVHSRFIVKKIESPRHIWTAKSSPELVDETMEDQTQE